MDLKEKTSYLPIGTLIVFLALIVFVVKPLLKDVGAYSEELFVLKKSLVLLSQKSTETPKLKQRLEELGPDLEKIENLFVDPETPVEFLQFLEKVARNSDLRINISFVSGEKDKDSAFPFLRFRLSLIGASSNCLRFLEKLEASPYLIETGDFLIRRLGEKELESKQYLGLSSGDVNMNLSITVFTK